MTLSNSPSPASFLSLGSTGPKVYAIGLGCMGMSGMYGASQEEMSVKTIHYAIEHGVNLLDTGDFYGMGHNEELIRKAIVGRRDKVILSVKFGALRGPDGSWIGVDNRPAALKNFLAYSLKRLQVDVIDIYRPARLDPNVPIEETIGAIADMIKAGYVRHVGLSEVGAETIRKAHAVSPVCDLQIEYSVASRSPEAKIFPVLKELGISATLYGVLSRGLLTGSAINGPGDYRGYLPRFTGDAKSVNDVAVATLKQMADSKKVTPGQLAIAWVRAREPNFVPVLGSRTVPQIEEALGALSVSLSSDELATLDSLKFAGERYAPVLMQHLDSER